MDHAIDLPADFEPLAWEGFEVSACQLINFTFRAL
jgi:hypothetical protein